MRQAAEQEDIRVNTILANSAPEGAPNVCQLTPDQWSDQCSWCGFKGHTRKTKKSYPQYENYDDTKYEKGSKVSPSPEWVPGTRFSH